MKYLLKRIAKGLFVFGIVISIFSCVQVFATETEDNTEEKKEPDFCKQSQSMIERYGITLEEKSSGKYVVKMNPKSSDADLLSKLRANTFALAQVNSETYEKPPVLEYKKPIEIDAKYDDNGAIKVILVSTSSNTDPDCTGKMEFRLTVSNVCATDDCKAEPIKEHLEINWDGLKEGGSRTIDCTINNTDAFAINFCDVKNKAVAAGNAGYTSTSGFDIKDTLKCDVNKYDTSTADGYYVNKQYFYGVKSSTKTETNVKWYTFNFAPGHVETQEVDSCEVDCEEALVVEYGPPVASKAGLCFEYKVKVTSRVSCGMKGKIGPPPQYNEVCTPSPLCVHKGNGYSYWNQGGPSEEFDSCVKKCDGGKYSDKCTNKCYKSVYGKSLKKTSTAYRPYIAEKLSLDTDIDECVNSSEPFYATNGGGQGLYKGCYYVKNNVVYWKGEKVGTDTEHNLFPARTWFNAPGRWYAVAKHKDLREYYVNESGFYMHDYDGKIDGEGDTCHDDCSWQGDDCLGQNVYLNPGQAQKDITANMDIYKSEYNKCVAAASCTTSTGIFTISVSYSHDVNGAETTTKIDFPYSSNKNDFTESDWDKLNSSEKDCEVTGENNKGITKPTILSYAGCYEGSCGPDIMYMTEWSFPGTWINNKTGEISYVDKSTDAKWQKKPKKFCIPLDAKDVNQKWWSYYMTKEFVNEKDTSVEEEAYEESCPDVDTNPSPISQNDSSIEWNINASTKNFGQFGWKINISCFYALSTKLPSIGPPIDKCVSKPLDYDVRPVDLREVFPDSGDGTKRYPGYNWTDHASTSSESDYVILPEEYLAEIEDEGYAASIYDDKYLDYQVKLTPELMKKLRGKKYSEFNEGSVFELGDGQIAFYLSDLLRDGILKDVTTAPPKATTLKCNNLVNHSEAVKCSIPYKKEVVE